MRWDSLRLTDDDGTATSGPAPLLPRGSVTRRFDTPEFRGITFHEVTARSALNRVPEASRMPFRWTINPYRGCSHACIYCFARKTHEYLDLDSGHDFDSQIVVKTNVGEVLQRELARPSWTGEHIAMGTNVDCYQRAEGRYRLMPDILRALSDVANPFSILTKGALILRDLPLLERAADVADVSAAVSVGCLDEDLWRLVEPGTPPPLRRLDVARTLTASAFRAGVLMAPILPYLTDSDDQLEATVARFPRPGRRTSLLSSCTCVLAPATGGTHGCGVSDRTWCLATTTCTPGARTRPSAYQQAITPRCASWRTAIAAAARSRGGADRPLPVTDPVRGTVPAAAAQLSLLDA